MRGGTAIPEEARAYIAAHLDDRPRTTVARAAGVSMNTLYRIVRELGGERRMELARRKPGVEEGVRRLYPSHTAAETAAMLGVGKASVLRWAARLGVRHTAETEARIREDSRARLAAARPRIDRKAAATRWRLTRRRDELRVMSGERQRTGFRFAAMPPRSRQAKWYLCVRYGYLEAPSRPFALWYDRETVRTKKEAYFARKYGFEFLEWEENV